MRKITLLFFSVLIILLAFTSCHKEPAPIVCNFSGKFTAFCNGVKIQGKAVVNKNNILSLAISSPESMESYTYYYKEDRLFVKFENMKVKAGSNYLPKTAFPSIVYNIFRSLSKENNCYLSGENELYAEYKGNCDSGEYTITTQYSMGTIDEIRIEAIDFKIKFKALKIIS